MKQATIIILPSQEAQMSEKQINVPEKFHLANLLMKALVQSSSTLIAHEVLNLFMYSYEIYRGWKRNNWISLIHYSIHFFLSNSLFRIQFCSIFINPFQVCRIIPYNSLFRMPKP